MTRAGVRGIVKDLRELGSMCEAECWGRCRRCPDDVRDEAITALELYAATLPVDETPKPKRKEAR